MSGGCLHGPGTHPAPDLCPNCGTITQPPATQDGAE